MPLFRSRKLAVRLAVWIAGCSISIYSAAVYLDYTLSKHHIVEKSELQATQIVSSAVADLTATLAGVQRSTDLFARVLSATRPPHEEAARLLHDIVASRDDIYGATIAFEPTEEHPAGFAPYFFHSGGEVRFADLAAPEYRFTTKDWYAEPRSLRRAVWSEPYFDEGGGDALMTTYSVPLLGEGAGARDFMGVVTADITLERLQEYLGRIHLGTTGYAALLSRKGFS
jgi:sigma-B regulation protein RsbU (phosphoserine phosphatase)